MFVYDLSQAYIKYAASLRFTTEILYEENGHVSLKITGANVYQAFKNESGKHVIQRVPPTERAGRKHTSVISVVILALPPENKLKSLLDKDLETICQTGRQRAGGQHANKTASAVRMKHKPTGLSVFINGRNQMHNKKLARHILTAKVNEQAFSQQTKAYNSTRETQMKINGTRLGGRGNKTRTYNFIRGEIVDNNLNKSTKDIKSFMKGDFNVLFNS